MLLAWNIPFRRHHREIGISAQPNACENGLEPNEPNALEIGPPHEATNLIIRVKTPAVIVWMKRSNGPSK